MTAISPDLTAERNSLCLGWLIALTCIDIIGWQAAVRFVDEGFATQTSQRLLWLSFYYALVLVPIGVIFINYGLHRLARDRFSWVLLLGLATFFASAVASGTRPDPLVVIAPIFMILVFHVIPHGRERVGLAIPTILLAVWSSLPFLYGVFVPDDRASLYASDSFRGFAHSRTDYGYLAGLSILLLLMRLSVARMAAALLVLVGLILSQNRAGELSLALVGAFAILSSDQDRRVRATVLVLMGVGVVSLALGATYLPRQVGLFQDVGARGKIFSSALQSASDSWLFGEGDFHQQVIVITGAAIEAHNSVLQSILNFGVFATVGWLLNVGALFRHVGVKGRAIILYWFIFGLFHPGFDAFIFVPESFLALLLATQAEPENSPAY